MPVLNSYYPHGSASEQSLYQSLITESIHIKGEEFYYIPRTLVAKDDILTEDSLSRFKSAYPFAGYVEDINQWAGAGSFMQRFGVFLEEQATISVSKEIWDNLVTDNVGKLPDRPFEGDLLWFPTTKSLLEIRFVEHQSHFYALHKQFVYKLKVELFTFSSERIETGIEELDNFAMDKTFDLLERGFDSESGVDEFLNENGGILVTEDPNDRKWDTRSPIRDESDSVLDFDERNPFAEFDR